MSDEWMNGVFWMPEELPKQKIKCECGTTIAMENHDHPQFHSDWCPVYIDYKLKEKYATPKTEE
jgi:hypothetical protein